MAMAPHSSTLAWKIPWAEEPSRLQSMGSQRVRHDWATSLSLSLSCIGEGNGNPLQCSCLENPRDGGAWGAAISGVAQSWTRLKWLSSSTWLSSLQCRGPGFDPWVRKILWRREWQPTPIFLPGGSHGQRILVVYSPWGHKRSDTPEWLTHNRNTFHKTLCHAHC